MKNNPLVGYAAISPASEFMKAGQFNAVVGPSRRAWLQAFTKEKGMSGWLIMPIYVNYLYAVIDAGGRGSIALDSEAFEMFGRFALARGWEPAEKFGYQFSDAESIHVTTFFVYREVPGRN